MGPGLKEEQTKRGSKCFKLNFVFFLLNISSFFVPVTGYVLRSCHISYSTAICSKRRLTAVPQDIPSTVKGLDLYGNKISKIQVSDFKKLSNLTELNLKWNIISEIDTGSFTNLNSLKMLNLNDNKLTGLGDNVFDGLGSLTHLRMNRNQIKTVASTSFKSLTNLMVLDISVNKLYRITNVHTILQHLPNLLELSVANNNLTSFQSWELTNSSLKLGQLDLSQNPIGDFRITADVFPNLTWLNTGGSSKRHHMKWDVRNKTFLRRVSTFDISGLQIPSEDMKTILGTFNSSLTTVKMNDMKRTYLRALINISCSIPTVSSLQLRSNNLFFMSSNLLSLCFKVTELDLADNSMKNIKDDAFKHLQGIKVLALNHNRLSSVPAAIRNLPALEELDLSKNNITTLGCQDFANLTKLRQLSLHQNSISALQGCVFKDLIHLEVLKLQNNSISKLNDAFIKYLPNLRQLHLNSNKLTAIKHGEFRGLRSLQNLSLHDNQITVLEKECFTGLRNLMAIQLQMNHIKRHKDYKDSFRDLINLKRLDLSHNSIKYIESSALPDPPFSHLSNLERLAFTGNHRRVKSQLPCNFLQGLTNLLDFTGRNLQLLSLHKDTFNHTPKLQKLDISSNELMDLSSELFYPIRNLKSLYISRINLGSLDFFKDANLTKLEFLQARRNQFSVFSEEVLESMPALAYLDLQGNSFTCDCDNAWFLKWTENNQQTQVSDAYNFVCNYPPHLKGMKLLKLDVRSCTVDTEFICFISTTCTILVFMVASFTYHFLRWYLAYAYYIFLAFLFDTKHKNKQAPNQYDAFISYNTHDEPWVIRQLLPKLEGEQGWRLCLHHRDFEPGKPIIDNITDAIYGSRKTICVISHRYLESEWCSREIQVASFRLFDEQKDVLILVFLEDIPTTQLSPYYRMRKLLKRQTYLSWPRASEHPELFWEKLRQAMKTREDLGEDELNLTVTDKP
uniref:Toll-like receptor 22 n=1 Tax=Epinephelus coioides TaxID=94232 RepID=A0A0A6ZA50_EPICO|nr:toll-like receptor 22 [Epinephelus coioides]